MNMARNLCAKEAKKALIESLAQDGRGVTHIDGKAVFIHGALPGELVSFVYEKLQKRFDEARVQEVLEPAPDRVTPQCQHFGLCGGCVLQHLQTAAQIQAKEQILRDAFEHIGKVQPTEGYLPPLVATHWGYRRKARLGAKYVARKGKMLVGFRERRSSFVTDLTQCAVLHPKLGLNLLPLATTLEKLAIRDRIPQIEMAMGDDICVLVIRVLTAPSESDLTQLREFGDKYGFHIYLQTGGPHQLQPLNAPIDLSYSLPDLGLRLYFQPLDFTQVHLELNRLLVNRALELLDPQPTDQILDLFCGIGNFTLPLATRAGMVTGVEGDAKLVERARHNAAANNLNNCKFFATDLYAALDNVTWRTTTFNKILLDPPRTGAAAMLPYLPQLGAQRILYISCYPATLARDAGVLVNELGYTLQMAGVMDMFPHTAHVESLALFVHKNTATIDYARK